VGGAFIFFKNNQNNAAFDMYKHFAEHHLEERETSAFTYTTNPQLATFFDPNYNPST
jgi:hypothetical protein